MKGFEKGLSPSKSNATGNLSSSGWVENNENDSSGDKLIPQFENHNITFGKHCMSVAQRKKILAEINEIPSVSDAQNRKNCNLNLGNSPPKMGISDGVVSCCGDASEPKDASYMVYDPLKNSLSPRPQFLRFNPNRRRHILKRLEKKSVDELDSSLDSDEVKDEEESSAEEIDNTSLSPPEVCVVNQRNGGISEEAGDNVLDVYEVEEEGEGEEEEEEIEEERGWCLRGVLKLFLTLIACLLSTSYICSMNSPTNAPIQQTIWNIKDSGLVIKNGTPEFVNTRLHNVGIFEVEVGGNYRGIEEVQIYKENYGKIDESFEAEMTEYLEWHEKEMVGYENEDSEDIVDEAAEYEGVGAAQFDFEVDKLQQLIDATAAENIDDGSMLLDQEVESSCTGLDGDNVNDDEAAETEIIGSGEVDSEPQSSGQMIGAKTVECEDASESDLEMEIYSNSIQLQGPELSLISISEEITTEPEGADDTGSIEELVASYGELSDTMDEVGEAEVGMEKSEWNTSTIVGISAVFILTSLAIIHHSKKSRRSTSSEESEPAAQKQKFAVEENVNTVLPVPSVERKVEFLARAPLSSHSMREAPRELANHIHAPTVELIGEIVVGQPRRSSQKYQMTISDNDYCATLSQKHDSLPQLVSALSQPSAIEPHATTSFTSYGSSTTERKISKKEGGQSREAMIGNTPVRRSSRLRNRSSVMSP
ncbi:hypothetical protein C2S52_000941 [Perilla frutescens var. hirtella]|nr:hypothetical protein C2S52_000941 [Perilla frutescens var. hirtella]